jgi:uncharacterized protein YegP (UPF0339 family)
VAAKFELFRDSAGEYRWHLKAPNGKVIADSGEGYVSKVGAENGIAAVKADAPTAAVHEL